MRGEQRASGDELASFLAREWDGRSPVRVSPPRSWAALKPQVWPWLRARREGGLAVPRFVGYPRCGFGADWLEIDCAPALETAPAACAGCGVRASCSPPAEWHDELQPFSGAPPLELWRRYRARLAALVEVDARIDALVEAHLACDVAVTRRNPITLEPSLTLGDQLEPSVRLAIFRGPPLADRGAAMGRTGQLIDNWVKLHALLGSPAPDGLAEALARFAPCSFSLGLDARRGRILLKGYLEALSLTADEKRARVGELARLAGLSGEPQVPWEAVDLIAVGTLDGRVASLKLYVRREPAADWPEFSLPAVAREHALYRWSSGQAYAVVDLAAVEPRPPKWDFALRQQLLTGAMLAADARGLFGANAQQALARMVAHHEFRADVVAAGWRAGRATLYLDLA